MLLTREYIKTLEREEIKIGNKYYLGELVNGDEDLEEIIKGGAIAEFNHVNDELEKVAQFTLYGANEEDKV